MSPFFLHKYRNTIIRCLLYALIYLLLKKGKKVSKCLCVNLWVHENLLELCQLNSLKNCVYIKILNLSPCNWELTQTIKLLDSLISMIMVRTFWDVKVQNEWVTRLLEINWNHVHLTMKYSISGNERWEDVIHVVWFHALR